MKRTLKISVGTLLTALIIYMLYSIGVFSKLSSNISLGRVSQNNESEWNCKFYFLQGGLQGKLVPRKENSRIIFSSNIAKGIVDFKIYNSKDSCLYAFSSQINTDTLEGFSKNEEYTIKAKAQKAQGYFNMKILPHDGD